MTVVNDDMDAVDTSGITPPPPTYLGTYRDLFLEKNESIEWGK